MRSKGSRNSDALTPFTTLEPELPTTRLTKMAINSHSNISVECKEVDITTLYPPDARYDISERPWLPGSQKPFVFVNANIVDPRASKIQKGVTLHIAGGHIVSVEPTTPKDEVGEFFFGSTKAQKVDASRFFICPGLIDCQ